MKKLIFTALLFCSIAMVFGSTGDPIKIIRSKHRLMLFCNNKIRFELSSSDLNSSAVNTLSIIAKALMQNPELKIEIGVYTDTRGDIENNKKLTQKRADVIKEFLSNYGISPNNLIARGYGDAKILNKCKSFVKCTESEHNFNKRVEMKILNPEELENYTFVFPKKNN